MGVQREPWRRAPRVDGPTGQALQGWGAALPPVLGAHGSGPSHNHPEGRALSGPPSTSRVLGTWPPAERPKLAGGMGGLQGSSSGPSLPGLCSAPGPEAPKHSSPPTSPGPGSYPHLLQAHPLAGTPLCLSLAPDSGPAPKGPAFSLPGPSSPPTPRGQGPGLSPVWAAGSQQGKPRTGTG